MNSGSVQFDEIAPYRAKDVEGLVYDMEIDFLQQLITTNYCDQPCRVLEIGSFKGKSTLAFLECLPHIHVTCCDHFNGVSDSNVPHLVGKPTYDCFLHNCEHYIRAGRIEIIRDNSSNLDKHLEAGQDFDVVFVDGEHTYEGASRDIAMTLARLKPGGLILVHDVWLNAAPEFIFHGVYRAVCENLMYKYKFLYLARSLAVFKKDLDYKNYR